MGIKNIFQGDIGGQVFRYLPPRDFARCRVVCKDAQTAAKQMIQEAVNNFPEAINTDSRPIKDIINDPNYKQKEYFDILRSLSPAHRRQPSKDIREKLNDDKKEQLDNFLRNVAFILGKTDPLCRAISCGADVNSTDRNDNTVLHNTAGYGHEKIMQVLLKEENIDINRANIGGKTALQIAAFHGHAGIVKALIKKGADVSHVDDYGKTALHEAAYIGCTEVVKTLLKAGADINCVNNAGSTALQLAASRGHADVAKMFERAKLRKKVSYPFSKIMQKVRKRT